MWTFQPFSGLTSGSATGPNLPSMLADPYCVAARMSCRSLLARNHGQFERALGSTLTTFSAAATAYHGRVDGRPGRSLKLW